MFGTETGGLNVGVVLKPSGLYNESLHHCVLSHLGSKQRRPYSMNPCFRLRDNSVNLQECCPISIGTCICIGHVRTIIVEIHIICLLGGLKRDVDYHN